MTEYKFRSKLWAYPGMAAWRFLSLPAKDSQKIKTLFGDLAKGWGSLPVKVTVNKTEWKTSIFPDKKRQCYLLPLKREVRKKEQIEDKNTVNFKIRIII